MSTATELDAQALAEKCARVMWDADPASQKLGMTLVSVAPGEAVITMPVQEFMLNGHKTCHGGYLFSLADSCFAFACNTYNQRTVAQHCNISYMAPGLENDMLTASAREVMREGRNGIYDVTVTNQDGQVIAHFRGFSRTIKGTLLDN